MGLGHYLRPRIQDLAMRAMNEWRPETLEAAVGDVLEVGFGTGLNLRHYPPAVESLTGLDPLEPGSFEVKLARRLAAAPFPVERVALPADGGLPFEDGRFDTLVTTWTLCSIPDPARALAEMRRVLKPGGRYLFVEHGRSDTLRTARWQDRLDPLWARVADGCHMNRRIHGLVLDAGFELKRLDRFRARGPGLLANMFRGEATTRS